MILGYLIFKPYKLFNIIIIIFSVFLTKKKSSHLYLADDQRIWLANKEGPLFWQSELKKTESSKNLHLIIYLGKF